MKCINCGKESINPYPLCFKCYPDLLNGDRICLGCGYPTSEFVQNCRSCESEIKNISLFNYISFPKEILKLYKFSGLHKFSIYYVDMLELYIDKDVLICPIPTPYLKRVLKKGYHLDPIIKELKKRGYKVKNLLSKRYSRSQKELNRDLRKINSNNLFKIKSNNIPLESRIILFDDVYTTGSTIKAGYETLKKSGFKTITSITLYRD